jgi:hypothetical protein
MDERPQHERSEPPATPRWVKVFGIVAAVVILVVAFVLLTGGHGPGRHGIGSDAPPTADRAAYVP